MHSMCAKFAKRGPLLAGAIALAAAVTLQAALGILTLLMVAPIGLALLHQATAMLVLTVATLHAAPNASRVACRARQIHFRSPRGRRIAGDERMSELNSPAPAPDRR